MKKISLGGVALVCAFCSLYAQDPRERNYFYEILDPKHEPKPLVEGFAQERITENLNRGLAVAPSRDGKSVYLSWRLLASDAPATAFHVYREVGGKACRLTKKAVSRTCDFVDTAPHAQAVYWVEAVAKGQKPVVSEKRKVVLSDLKPYTSIRLKDNAKAGKIALADLNGDGTYDYIVRTPETNVDPGMPGDTTGKTYKISAYLSDGTYLWTYDMGPGIEPGIWYSPFIVYDFNGDGKAEVAIKTAGTDYVKNEKGRVCGGSEYLSVLDGMTGQEIDRVDWPERNDRYGNLIRQNRNQMGVAYLDGKTPFILAARGTYKLMVVDAWMLKNGKLERAWRWDGDEENPIVRSMGAHSMVTADVDGDGRDEVMLGSCMLDDNGTLLWSSGLGHSDKAYLCKLHPDREGMQVFMVSEPKKEDGRGVSVVDAATGKLIWSIGHTTYHVGDGMVTDFDPAHPGLECFASEDRKGGSTDRYLLTADGKKLQVAQDEIPGCRNWIWWDADLLRETFKGDNNRRCQSPISGRNLENVAITGEGAIDGNGHYWRPLKREKVTESVWKQTTARGGVYKRPTYWFPYPETLKGDTISNMNVPQNLKTEEEWQSVRHFLRPVMVSLIECKNVWLQGVIFQNSPAWNLHPLMCENVLVEDVQVRNPSYAQNGDGLDLESCKNALIVNSTFDVGDDGICLKSGKDEDGRRRARPCENVVVDGCTVFKGHGGFVVGSEMSGGVRNVSVSNCQFLGTDVGLRFKSKRGRGGIVENIWITNVSMMDIPTEPITFNLYYGGKSAVEVLESGEKVPAKVDPLPVDETTPCFRNIHVKNLVCAGARRALFFNGIPEMPIENVVLEDVDITSRLGAEFVYSKAVTMKNVTIRNTEGEQIVTRFCEDVK